jgi:hypothetical protein
VPDGLPIGTPDPPKPAIVEEPQQKASEVKPGSWITGTVKDENGQSLQYANVFEEDEYHRVVARALTDKNGKFLYKVVNPKNKIRVTYVGFKSKTLDISGSEMDVALEPATTINNIQVVGHRDSVDLNSPRYNDQTKAIEEGRVFDLVEQAPSYPGGMGEIMGYLSRKLMYPPVAREMRVEAEITVKFTVDKTGFVRSPQVIEVNSQSPLVTAEIAKAAKEGDEEAAEVSRNYYDAVEALKEEAIHVVRNMPRWEPGRQNGKRVETTYTLPVSFKLNK